MTKRSVEEVEAAVLRKVYDLILNPETTEEERVLLVLFKEAATKNKDMEKPIMDLSKDLSRLAIKKYKEKTTLSSEVGELYKEISDTGLLKKNLGYGIIATSQMFKF
ncbi:MULTISPECIES: bacteriocin immunity protein [Vagococcus]|uniref:No significant homology n=1 Tax=Vagococcus fluvialis bH819 TaxID=1255619 RepID=A0A1X6WL55_9ENTE|nr:MULTISPECIES: bacteriocin immunity protein [Vagococcus]SLM84989.1 no significant homology [Vagococcus fluvialis bH819]HCM88594.1 bacteriocin immunity protein [Vagococcus sp.]